jgi:asparagine N-glycosylation enzyme membrane subunit Stt3
MSESKHISGLLRGLTIKRTSNRIVVLGSALALIAYLTRSLSEQWVVGNPMSVGEAFTSSVVVFAAWALTRELDPDHPWPAAVAMVASFVVGLWFVPAAFVVVAAAAALRMISGTVGRSLTPIDLGVFAIVG